VVCQACTKTHFIRNSNGEVGRLRRAQRAKHLIDRQLPWLFPRQAAAPTPVRHTLQQIANRAAHQRRAGRKFGMQTEALDRTGGGHPAIGRR
jgi:hypothetical protein